MKQQSSWRDGDVNKLHSYLSGSVTKAKTLKFHNPSLFKCKAIIILILSAVLSMKVVNV